MYPWFDTINEQLKQRISADHLHHGLLFYANNDIGQIELLMQLAKTLLCSHKTACGHCKSCLLFEAGSHPDLLNIESEKASIGVDLIRKISVFASSTSQMLGNKVVIINQLELMTESASNSLLKTLEEPNQNTYLLMATCQLDKLLATIKSRCELMRLAPANSSESLAWVASKTNLNVSEAGLRAYGDSPIVYLQKLQSDTLHYEYFAIDLEAFTGKRIFCSEFAKKWQSEVLSVIVWLHQILIDDYNKAMLSGSNLKELNRLSDFIESLNDKYTAAQQAGVNKLMLLQDVLTSYLVFRKN